MWRAFFLAIGFFVMILGVECLGVERVSLKVRDDPPRADFAVRYGGEGGAPEAGRSATLGPPGACWPRVR